MANWVKKFLEENPNLENKIVKRAKYAIHTRNEDGTITSRFTGAPMHYQDANDVWHALDTAIKNMGDDTYGAEGIPVRLLQNGLVKLYNNVLDAELYSQVTSRVAVYNSDTNNIVQTEDLPVGTVDDDKLIKETDIYKHTLTLKETGLREEIVIKEKPNFITDKDYLWFVLDTVVTGMTFDDGWIDGEFSKEEYKFPLPRAHDADGKEGNPKRYAKTINSKQHVFTGLKFSELNQAVYPVTIDPDFTSETADGGIDGEGSSTFSVTRNTSASYGNTGIWILINTTHPIVGDYQINRGYLKFNTSSLPSNATVTQVNLSITPENIEGIQGDHDIYIIKCNWSNYDDWSNATERENAYDLAISSSKDDNIWANTTNLSVDVSHSSGNLNTSWVSLSSYTYYALVNEYDYDNSDPTIDEAGAVYIHSREASTSTYRPVLTVTYEVGIATRKALLGVGI